MKHIEIAPSLLSANRNDIIGEIQKAEKAGCKYIHIDIMDGKFVPNLSFDSEFVSNIHNKHSLINDVHIMVSNPSTSYKEYIDAGANILTFHYEACKNDEEIETLISNIKASGCRVGLSIKPKTNVESIYKFLSKIDLLLIMSVEPGFGGQSFILNSLNKIEKCRQFIDKNNYECLIEVDGGINDQTSFECIKAGADILVAGSYLYGHDDFNERLKRMF